MRILFAKQHKTILVLFADGTSSMFSEFDHERALMVYLWEYVEIYAHEHQNDPVTDTIDDPPYPGQRVFDYKSTNPHRYVKRGGPVPIQFPSQLVPFTSIVPPNFYCKEDWDYVWKEHEYMYTCPWFASCKSTSLESQPARQTLTYRLVPGHNSTSKGYFEGHALVAPVAMN
jgi:hypothetical protein